MRKSRIKFTEIEEKVLAEIAEMPDTFFGDLEELSIKIPTWSKLLLLVLSVEKKTMEVAFFEEARDFFLSYTKKVLRYPSLKFICFSKEKGNNWKLFSPPTLIGTNLKTKLRKKL